MISEFDVANRASVELKATLNTIRTSVSELKPLKLLLLVTQCAELGHKAKSLSEPKDRHTLNGILIGLGYSADAAHTSFETPEDMPFHLLGKAMSSLDEGCWPDPREARKYLNHIGYGVHKVQPQPLPA